MTSHRTSPIAIALQPLQGEWRDINQMPTLVRLESETGTTLNLSDVSCLTRFGVKGTGAGAWLAQQGIPIPDRPNTWLSLPDGGLIARLGLTEFLIEDSLDTHLALQLTKACQSPPKAVYPVLRQDAAIALYGTATHELLLQTCSVNFRSFALVDRPVMLTSMAGVSVTVIPGEQQGVPFYRLWCDGTFGAYMWQTLLAIAQELGGSIVGIEQINQLSPVTTFNS